MQKVVRQFSKLGSFKLLGWLATFFYGGIQAQSYIKLLGWLANPILILIFLGKHSQEFLENLDRLVGLSGQRIAKRAFEELRSKLSTNHVLQPPNWEKFFHVFCDASNVAVGSALYQSIG